MYSFDKIRAIISEADLDGKFEEATSKTLDIEKYRPMDSSNYHKLSQ